MSNIVVSTTPIKNENTQTLINNVNITNKNDDVKVVYVDNIETNKQQTTDNVFAYPEHLYPSGVDLDNNYNIIKALLIYIDSINNKRFKYKNNKYILYKTDFFNILSHLAKSYIKNADNSFEIVGEPTCSGYHIDSIVITIDGQFMEIFSVPEIKNIFDHLKIDSSTFVFI